MLTLNNIEKVAQKNKKRAGDDSDSLRGLGYIIINIVIDRFVCYLKSFNSS